MSADNSTTCATTDSPQDALNKRIVDLLPGVIAMFNDTERRMDANVDIVNLLDPIEGLLLAFDIGSENDPTSPLWDGGQVFMHSEHKGMRAFGILMQLQVLVSAPDLLIKAVARLHADLHTMLVG